MVVSCILALLLATKGVLVLETIISHPRTVILLR
jgi:hypothetical protein